MNTLEIFNYLRHYRDFKGVFPLDKIPKINNGTIIVNSDESTKPGEHWVGLTIKRKGISDYFDSFGLYPFYEIEYYLDINSPNGWVYNTINLQSISSTTCGNFCVLYASMRCRGYSCKKILSLFTNNTETNDEIVKTFVKRLK